MCYSKTDKNSKTANHNNYYRYNPNNNYPVESIIYSFSFVSLFPLIFTENSSIKYYSHASFLKNNKNQPYNNKIYVKQSYLILT